MEARNRFTRWGTEECLITCWAEGRPNELSAQDWLEAEFEKKMKYRLRMVEIGKELWRDGVERLQDEVGMNIQKRGHLQYCRAMKIMTNILGTVTGEDSRSTKLKNEIEEYIDEKGQELWRGCRRYKRSARQAQRRVLVS